MGKSSRDKRDAYYRLAKEQGWLARSAYKLLQLDEEFNLFDDNVTRVVDLCAAPGSWSQVLSRVLIRGETFGRAGWDENAQKRRAAVLGSSTGEGSAVEQVKERRPRKDVRIVAIDLQPMAPLEGVTTLRADITHPSTIPLLLRALDQPTGSQPTAPSTSTSTASTDAPVPDPSDNPTPSTSIPNPQKVDLLLSDGAPDVTGLHDLDIAIQASLLRAALSLALAILEPGTGKFVAKIFRGKDVDVLFAQLRCCFARVRVAKPRSSRASSVEAFVVCEGFFGAPAGGEVGVEALSGKMEGLSVAVQDEPETRRKPKSQPTRHTRPDGVVEIDLGSDSEASTSDPEDQDPRWIPAFLACGDLSAYDSDATYRLPKDRVSLDPVQPPTAPPYRRALEMRRLAGGAYGKTKGRSGEGQKVSENVKATE